MSLLQRTQHTLQGLLGALTPKNRVGTGVLVVLVMFSTLSLGGWVWATMVGLAMAQCFEELRHMLQAKQLTPSRMAFYGVVVPLVVLATLGKIPWLWPVVVLGFSCSFIQWLFHRPRLSVGDLAASLLSIIYVGFIPVHTVLLRQLEPHAVAFSVNAPLAAAFAWAGQPLTGLFYTLFSIGVIACSDIGAYYVGKRFGKHLLLPDISPKKTQEGAMGGLVCGLLFGASLSLISGFPLHYGFILSTLLVIVGALGDLIESKLKREVGVKDSGGLLAGHGGLLDRVDSYMFSLAVAYYYIHWVVNQEGIAKELKLLGWF